MRRRGLSFRLAQRRQIYFFFRALLLREDAARDDLPAPRFEPFCAAERGAAERDDIRLAALGLAPVRLTGEAAATRSRWRVSGFLRSAGVSLRADFHNRSRL